MFVYADNAATTRLSETALAAMLPCLREQYGNPSSLHAAGQAASGVLVRARETMARLLGCAPHELVFTSGGSESDNQALLSACLLYTSGSPGQSADTAVFLSVSFLPAAVRSFVTS